MGYVSYCSSWAYELADLHLLVPYARAHVIEAIVVVCSYWLLDGAQAICVSVRCITPKQILDGIAKMYINVLDTVCHIRYGTALY